MKFYYQSVQDATVTYSLTATTGFPITNIQDRNNNTLFKDATIGGDADIKIDFGAAVTCDYIILSNLLIEHASGGTPNTDVYLSHSDDNITYTDDFQETGWDDEVITTRLKTFTSGSHRYWRIRFKYLGQNFNIELANIFLGTAFEPSRNPDLNNVTSYEFSSTITEALGGGRFAFGDHDSERMNWNYNFDYLSETDKTNFIAFYRGIYAGEMSRYPFYFSDPAGTVHYGRLAGVPQITEIGYQAYTSAIVISEEL